MDKKHKDYLKEKYLNFEKDISDFLANKGLENLSTAWKVKGFKEKILELAENFIKRDPDDILFQRTGSPILSKSEREIYDLIGNVPYRSNRYKTEHLSSFGHTQELYEDICDWANDVFSKGKYPFDVKILCKNASHADVGLILHTLQGEKRFIFPTAYDEFIKEVKEKPEAEKDRPTVIMIPTTFPGALLPHYFNTVAIFDHKQNIVTDVVFIDSFKENYFRLNRNEVKKSIESHSPVSTHNYNVNGFTLEYQDKPSKYNGCRIFTGSAMTAVCEALISDKDFLGKITDFARSTNLHADHDLKEQLRSYMEIGFYKNKKGEFETTPAHAGQEMYKVKWAVGNRYLDEAIGKMQAQSKNIKE